MTIEVLYSAENQERLKERTRRRLEKLNLKLTTNRAMGVVNPRYNSNTLWVGVDCKIPKALMINAEGKYTTFKMFAELYLQGLGKNIDNFYMWGVLDEGVNQYKVVEPNTKWTGTGCTFIVVDKSYMVETYADNLDLGEHSTFEAAFLNKSLDIVQTEVAMSQAWCYDNTWDVTVSAVNRDIVHTIQDCYDVSDIIDKAVNSAIDKVVEKIDRAPESWALIVKVDTKLIDGADPISYIADMLYLILDKPLTFGSTYFDKSAKEACIVFFPAELPSLTDIVQHSGYHIVDKMEEYVCNEKRFNDLNTWDIVRMLTTAEPFSNWSDIMQSALLHSLFGGITGTTFKSATIRTGKLAA